MEKKYLERDVESVLEGDRRPENVPSVFCKDRRMCASRGICEGSPGPDIFNFCGSFGRWARFRGMVWLRLEKNLLALWLPEFCSVFCWLLVWRNAFERPGHWLSLGFRRSHRRERADSRGLEQKSENL